MPPKDESTVSVPRWFVQVVSAGVGFISLVGSAAVPWAWNIDRNVTKCYSSLEALDKVHAVEMLEIKRRVDRHEDLIEALRGRGTK